MKRRRSSRLEINMQKWFRAIALIRRIEDGQNRWLARAKAGRPNVLDFISTPRLEGESFREAIRREAAWTLNLDAHKDLLVSSMAQLNLEFVACLPRDESGSHVAVSFFLVEIYGQRAMQQITDDPANRWLTSREVCAGELETGETLNPRLIFLLDRAKVINAWD